MSSESSKITEEQKFRFRQGLFEQFQAVKFAYTKQHSTDEEQLPFILKTRRIEYLFKNNAIKQREDSKYLNLAERADIELANNLKYENYKYMNLSTVLGVNVGFFSYQAMKTKLYWYVALPLSFGAYFVSRNIVMRNCMDRIYYPGEMVYKRYRGTEAEGGKTQQVLKKEKEEKEETA